MRITGYLIVGLLGLGLGWWWFSPSEEAPPAERPVATPLSPQGPLPPQGPASVPYPSSAPFPSAMPSLSSAPTAPGETYGLWTNPASPRYASPPPQPLDAYQFRPLNKREEERLRTQQPPARPRAPDAAPGYSYPGDQPYAERDHDPRPTSGPETRYPPHR